MSFGYALSRFRDVRGLSIREVAKLSDIDHAYIYRLEKGEKTAPSNEVVDALVRALKLNTRHARLLRMLVGRSVHGGLVDVFIQDEERPVEFLEPLAQMSFRGKRPETLADWRRQADRLRQFLEDED